MSSESSKSLFSHCLVISLSHYLIVLLSYFLGTLGAKYCGIALSANVLALPVAMGDGSIDFVNFNHHATMPTQSHYKGTMN